MDGRISNHISFNDLEELRSYVKSFVDPYRFQHILGVEKKTIQIAALIEPDKVLKLRASAILHDITKNYSYRDHLLICKQYGFPYAEKQSPAVLHAITAALICSGDICVRFPFVYDPEIIGPIRWHATGRQNMSIGEAIVYLADYIEDGRTFQSCKELRDYFNNGLEIITDSKDIILHFYKTVVKSFDYTIIELIGEKKSIDINTIESRNYFINKIKDNKGSV